LQLPAAARPSWGAPVPFVTRPGVRWKGARRGGSTELVGICRRGTGGRDAARQPCRSGRARVAAAGGGGGRARRGDRRVTPAGAGRAAGGSRTRAHGPRASEAARAVVHLVRRVAGDGPALDARGARSRIHGSQSRDGAARAQSRHGAGLQGRDDGRDDLGGRTALEEAAPRGGGGDDGGGQRGVCADRLAQLPEGRALIVAYGTTHGIGFAWSA